MHNYVYIHYTHSPTVVSALNTRPLCALYTCTAMHIHKCMYNVYTQFSARNTRPLCALANFIAIASVEKYARSTVYICVYTYIYYMYIYIYIYIYIYRPLQFKYVISKHICLSQHFTCFTGFIDCFIYIYIIVLHLSGYL